MSSLRGISRRSAFTDTGAYFALGVTRDTNHEQARAIGERLGAEHWRLFTTNFVLAETHALYLNRVGRADALRALQRIEGSDTAIVPVTPADELRARAIIEQYADKDFTLTDATSFAVMERLGITYAFSFDRNFTQYGFALLVPPGRAGR